MRGIGRITLRRGEREIVFESGESFPIGTLRGDAEERLGGWTTGLARPVSAERVVEEESSFWRRVRAAETAFERGLDGSRPESLAGALLELDRIIWKGGQDLEDPEFIAQARERFREMVVSLGSVMEGAPLDRRECLAPLVEAFLRLREIWRGEKRWPEADCIRRALSEAGVIVEDAPGGAGWKLRDSNPAKTVERCEIVNNVE